MIDSSDSEKSLGRNRSRSSSQESGAKKPPKFSRAANNTIIEEEKESESSFSEVRQWRNGRAKNTVKMNCNDPATLYLSACEKLQLSAIPDSLPCRDNERKYITDYIERGLNNKGSSSSLFISGMPGTGKTATTLEIIESLK